MENLSFLSPERTKISFKPRGADYYFFGIKTDAPQQFLNFLYNCEVLRLSSEVKWMDENFFITSFSMEKFKKAIKIFLNMNDVLDFGRATKIICQGMNQDSYLEEKFRREEQFGIDFGNWKAAGVNQDQIDIWKNRLFA